MSPQWQYISLNHSTLVYYTNIKYKLKVFKKLKTLLKSKASSPAQKEQNTSLNPFHGTRKSVSVTKKLFYNFKDV